MVKMWKKCTGLNCKYCKVGQNPIHSSLVMPNNNSYDGYVHHISLEKNDCVTGIHIPLHSDVVVTLHAQHHKHE